MTIEWNGLTPPYGTIVVDPPWRYNNTRGTQTRSTRGRRAVPAEGHYSTMNNADLAALPVMQLAASDAHLYMWVTNPRLFRGRGDDSFGPIDIVEAWGFQYITLITWVKTGPLGLGFYYRGQTEHVIFATRGKAPIPSDKRVKNVIMAPQRGHSVKPPELADIIENVSPGPYVELFGRQQRLGWDTWGHGIEVAS